MRYESLVIKVLQKYSSEYENGNLHPMTKREIQQRVCELYNGASAKNYKEYTNSDIPTYETIKNAVNRIVDVECSLDDKDRQVSYSDGAHPKYWYNNPIKDKEKRFLIDSILHSPIISQKNKTDLIDTIKDQSSKSLSDITMYTETFGEAKYTQNIDVLENIDIVSHAIKERQMIHFNMNFYNIKKELEVSHAHLLIPRSIIMGNNAKYYMFATYPNKDKVYFFRVDLMSDIDIKESNHNHHQWQLENGVSHAEFLNQHPLMYSGKVIPMTLRVRRNRITRVIDTFGTDVTIVPNSSTDEYIDIRVKACEEGMIYWLLLNSDVAYRIDGNDEFNSEMLKKAKNIIKNYE